MMQTIQVWTGFSKGTGFVPSGGKGKGIVRLNLLGRLSLSPFWDFRAQKPLLSGLDRTSAGDEGGSTTGKFQHTILV